MTDKYVGDQNQTTYILESGLYANPSGSAQWIGEVQTCTPADVYNINRTRYQGSGQRNVDSFDDTSQDHTVEIVHYPQNWRCLYFALGSEHVTSGGATPFTHTISQLNNNQQNGVTTDNVMPSVTIEQAQVISTGSNNIRSYRGAVLNKLTIKSDGEGLIEATESWMASRPVFTSGAASAVTAQTTRAWRASDFAFYLPSGTSTGLNNLKGWTFEINNNVIPNHYSNGSPYAANMTADNFDVVFTPTVDANKTWQKSLYEQYFTGGSEFNAMLRGVITTGSNEVTIFMSGCRLVNMENPAGVSGKNQNTLTIVPKTIHPVVLDTISRYKAF